MDTKSNLRELLTLIKATRPDYIRALGTGHSREEIESSISIHPIPDALIAIYSYVSPKSQTLMREKPLEDSEDDSFIPGYYLIPLNQIDSDIKTTIKVRNENIHVYDNRRGWRSDMIPFLEDGGGGYIYVRSLPEDQSVWVVPKVEDAYKINTNLDLFILMTIECYKQGAYYLDDELFEDMSAWDIDWEIAGKILSEIDPEIGEYEMP
jgi:hypothetical protein